MPRKVAIMFLPLVIFPAILPAVMLPLIQASHASAPVVVLVMGVPIALSLVAAAWLAKLLVHKRS